MLFEKGVKDSPDIDFIDFSSSCEQKERRGQLSSGECTYVMSDVNAKDKFSLGYFHCTGLIAVGKHKETGDNISFALHCPLYSKHFITNEKFKNLQSDLFENLMKLSSLSEEGTMDVVVFGGVVADDIKKYKYLHDIDMEKYRFIMGVYRDSVSTSLGFNPISVGGPKKDLQFDGGDDIYFDNKTRRLYFLRPKFAEEESEIAKRL